MGKNIMIVDDDPLFHDLYTTLLEDTEYSFIHTYDGGEAFAELEQEKPDLIITDILMDMVTGDTFLLYLKSIPECADIPVIVISAFSQKDYKNLKDIDPSFVYIEKSKLTEEILLKEVERKLRSSQIRKGFIIRERNLLEEVEKKLQ